MRLELADLLASATLDAELAGRLRVLWHFDAVAVSDVGASRPVGIVPAMATMQGRADALALLAWQDQDRHPKGLSERRTMEGHGWSDSPGDG